MGGRGSRVGDLGSGLEARVRDSDKNLISYVEVPFQDTSITTVIGYLSILPTLNLTRVSED